MKDPREDDDFDDLEEFNLSEEQRHSLAELVRFAIESIDFAQWEEEMQTCCDGFCHVVFLQPDGKFRIWCDCREDWVH